MNTKTKTSLKILIFLLLFGLSFSALARWTAPTSAPVGNSPEAPINAGSATQLKKGPLVVTGFRSMSYGIFNGDVIVGVNEVPTADLDVRGSFRLLNGNQGANKVMVSDANGYASWVNASDIPGVGGGSVSVNWGEINGSLADQGDLFGELTGLQNSLNLKAPINNPVFTGTVQTPTLRVTGGSPVADKVLAATDANGNMTWKTLSELGGGGSNVAWTQGVSSVYLTNSGDDVGIGTNSPTQQLEITESFEMPHTTSGTTGVIYKGADRFLHDYGTSNLFLGVNAGNFTTSGTGQNTIIGKNALPMNTTGAQNVSLGYETLNDNLTGSNNTSIGWLSLTKNTSGSGNTAIGSAAMYSNTTGYQNTAIGISAMYDNTTGYQNTALGTTASVQGNVYNATAIGFSASVNANNKVVIGNNSVNSIGGYAPWSNYSDLRMKENVVYTKDLGLDFISKLNTVSYNYKNDPNKNRRDGLIAQDVQKVLADLDLEFSGLTIDDNAEKTLNLSYGSFVVPLINSVQELNEKNDKLEAEIDLLKAEINKLKESIK